MTVWFGSSCIFQEGSTPLLRARNKSGKLMKVVSHNPNDDTKRLFLISNLKNGKSLTSITTLIKIQVKIPRAIHCTV